MHWKESYHYKWFYKKSAKMRHEPIPCIHLHQHQSCEHWQGAPQPGLGSLTTLQLLSFDSIRVGCSPLVHSLVPHQEPFCGWQCFPITTLIPVVPVTSGPEVWKQRPSVVTFQWPWKVWGSSQMRVRFLSALIYWYSTVMAKEYLVILLIKITQFTGG